MKIEVVASKGRKFKPRQFKAKRPTRRKKGYISINGDEVKLWSLKKADRAFSEYIRKRDGRCLHPNCICGSQMLQCSHYHSRGKKSTRFDPDNCITLGWLCHFKNKLIGFEYQKQTKEIHGFDGQYTLWMRAHLGEKGFDELNFRAQQTLKQKTAILNCMLLLGFH